jgi:hypothetical protein
MRDNRDQDYLEEFTYDADNGGEDFMGGQELSPASINLPAEVAPAMSAGFFSGIAGLPPEIAAAIAQLIAAQAAGAPAEVAPAEVAPAMVAGEAAGIPELLAQSDTAGSAETGALFDDFVPAISGKKTGIAKLVEQSIPDEVAPAMAPASVAGLPAEVAPAISGQETGIAKLVEQSIPDEVAPAMAAGQGSGIAELLAAPVAAPYVEPAPAVAAPYVEPAAMPAAPVAAAQAPTAREMMDGVGKDGQVAALSQTQGYGMVPVYQAQQGRGADRGEPVLMGYEFNPIAAGLTTVDAPKPAAILAEEKRIGKEMEPTYATYTAPRGQGGESVAYGPPTGYRYDNGQSQYVKFDSSGKYYETEKRKGDFDDALKMAALFAAITTGGASLGLGGAGAGTALGAGEGIGSTLAGLGGSPFAPAGSAAFAAPGYVSAAGIATLPGLESTLPNTPPPGLETPFPNTPPPGTEIPLPNTPPPGLETPFPNTPPPGTELPFPNTPPPGLETPFPNTPPPGTEAGIGSLGAPTLTAEELLASELAAYPPATVTPGSTLPGLGGSPYAPAGISSLGGSGSLFDAAASPLASGYSPSITALTNEAVASGTFTPGSLGSSMAAAGTLSPEALAAAAGVTTAGATPALVELGRAGKGLTSANEAVASGLGPGSAGAKAAVEGTLTAQELAAAAGTAGALNKDGIGDLLTKAKDAITDKVKDASSGSGSGMGILGLMALMSMMNKGGGPAPASTATIPELTATRTQLPYDVNKKGVNPNTPYRPGQGGVNYFSPTTYTPTKAAGGGLMSLGQSNLGSYSDGGRLLKGPGDGVSDSIPAIIGRKQPARLANGEFVIPARIVSELGNGSTDAGAKRLYEMMARVQKARRNTKNVAANTKAAKYLPA